MFEIFERIEYYNNVAKSKNKIKENYMFLDNTLLVLCFQQS